MLLRLHPFVVKIEEQHRKVEMGCYHFLICMGKRWANTPAGSQAVTVSQFSTPQFSSGMFYSKIPPHIRCPESYLPKTNLFNFQISLEIYFRESSQTHKTPKPKNLIIGPWKNDSNISFENRQRQVSNIKNILKNKFTYMSLKLGESGMRCW